MSRALERLIAAPGESLLLNCGYGRGFSVLEVLDAVDRVTNLPDRAPAGAAPRRRSGRGDRRQSRRSWRRCDWRPERDDLDTIVADALAWERKLAARG